MTLHPRRRPGARPGRRLRPPRRGPAARLVPRTAPHRSGQRAASEAGRDTGHQPKHPLKIKAKRDAQKQAALQRVLEGKKPFAKGSGKGQEVPARARGHRPDLRRARRVRRRALPRPALLRHPERSTSPTRSRSASTGRCTTRSPSRTGRVDNSTLWQADYDRGALRGHVLQPDGGVLRAPVLRSLHGRRRRHRVGEGALQPGALRPRLLRHPAGRTRHDLRLDQGAGPRRPGRLGAEPARRRPDDGADPGLPEDVRRPGPLRHRRRRQLRRSPTASSTTSRSSTRVATRRRATRPTAPTRSGATAGTPTSRPAARAASPASTSAPTAAR